MSGTTVTALLALLPAMIGPLPLQQAENSLVVAICGGGEVAIDLVGGDESPLPQPATTPCCAKGCRTSNKKRVLDPRQ